MCAPKDDDEYVVPDYIFVHKDYSFSNPIKPLLMVETKNPVIIKDETFYQKLSDFVDANKSEPLAEIRACKYVIFTDGITWMFLEEREENKRKISIYNSWLIFSSILQDKLCCTKAKENKC